MTTNNIILLEVIDLEHTDGELEIIAEMEYIDNILEADEKNGHLSDEEYYKYKKRFRELEQRLSHISIARFLEKQKELQKLKCTQISTVSNIDVDVDTFKRHLRDSDTPNFC